VEMMAAVCAAHSLPLRHFPGQADDASLCHFLRRDGLEGRHLASFHLSSQFVHPFISALLAACIEDDGNPSPCCLHTCSLNHESGAVLDCHSAVCNCKADMPREQSSDCRLVSPGEVLNTRDRLVCPKKIVASKHNLFLLEALNSKTTEIRFPFLHQLARLCCPTPKSFRGTSSLLASF